MLGLTTCLLSRPHPLQLLRLQSTGAALAAAAAAAVAEEGKAQAVQAVVAAAPDSHETFSCRAYRDEFAGGKASCSRQRGAALWRCQLDAVYAFSGRYVSHRPECLDPAAARWVQNIPTSS